MLRHDERSARPADAEAPRGAVLLASANGARPQGSGAPFDIQRVHRRSPPELKEETAARVDRGGLALRVRARHLGHLAGCYLPADIVARYHRLVGDEVLMVSGSDQHGTPITVAAERVGVSPERFADEQHDKIGTSFDRLGISFDLYTKTQHQDPHHYSDLGHQARLLFGQSGKPTCPSSSRVELRLVEHVLGGPAVDSQLYAVLNAKHGVTET
jgi:hypothetical protein